MFIVFKILFAALLTGATAYSLGMLLLRRLRLAFTGVEELPYAFVLGAAPLSLSVFLLTAVGLANIFSFVAVALLAIGACSYTGAYRLSAEKFPPLPWPWRALFIATFCVYAYFYLLTALAPEISSDGSSYHLGMVSQYFRQHSFGRVTTNMYANMPMGVEMIYMFAFAFGKHSAAATTHFLFYLALPLSILALARRHRFPVAGIVGALLVMLSPVVGTDGSTAYVDVATAAVVFVLFCLLQIWARDRQDNLLIPIGLLAGFAYACKLTAFLAVPYALGFVLWRLLRSREFPVKRLAVLCGCIALMILPWLVKNTLIVGNPFSPFLNKWFPNPYIHISLEQIYIVMNRTYPGITSAWQIPLELTIRGGKLQGFTGPAFLLLPLALFALRHSFGRRVLFAGLVFFATYAGNAGTRFAISALPFFALALAIALAEWKAMAATVVVFHILTCWPEIVRWYADPYSWRVDKSAQSAAFRKIKDDEYLSRNLPGFNAAKLIERFVPDGQPVFAFGGVAEAYCKRQVLIGYEAAFNNVVGDLLQSPLVESSQPLHAWTFHIKPQRVRALRVVTTQTGLPEEQFGISEMHVYGSGGELVRGGKWRLRAHPNPWDVQFAFDNSPLTQWRSWEREQPGMYVSVDFGEGVEISSVRLDTTHAQATVAARLEVEDDRGKWQVLTDSIEHTALAAPPHLRKLAADAAKRLGIHYLYLENGDFMAQDMFRNCGAWGATYLGNTRDGKLYRFD